MKASICKTYEEFEAAGPGAIFLNRAAEKDFEQGHVFMRCPGCGDKSAMHVRLDEVPHPPSNASWVISGLPDAVTFKPSINCVGCCKWHGYLTDGEYRV